MTARVEITEEMVTKWSLAVAKHLASHGYCFTDRELFDSAVQRALTAALSGDA